MKVSIKEFNVGMEVKTKGIEFDVKDPKGTHLGDLILTKTRLEWCDKQTKAGYGKKVTWEDFIKYMNDDKKNIVTQVEGKNNKKEIGTGFSKRIKEFPKL